MKTDAQLLEDYAERALATAKAQQAAGVPVAQAIKAMEAGNHFGKGTRDHGLYNRAIARVVKGMGWAPKLPPTTSHPSLF